MSYQNLGCSSNYYLPVSRSWQNMNFREWIILKRNSFLWCGISSYDLAIFVTAEDGLFAFVCCIAVLCSKHSSRPWLLPAKLHLKSNSRWEFSDSQSLSFSELEQAAAQQQTLLQQWMVCHQIGKQKSVQLRRKQQSCDEQSGLGRGSEIRNQQLQKGNSNELKEK